MELLLLFASGRCTLKPRGVSRISGRVHVGVSAKIGGQTTRGRTAMNRAVCWVLIVAAFVAPGSALAQAPAGGASSELTSLLAKELGSTTKQAEGAAGSLFRLAKTRMTPENFSKVATAVPDMDRLVAAAPALDAKGAAAGALGKKVGAEGLESLAEVR